MLSSELATLLSGRYVEFHIFPYSYAEYLQLMQQPAGRASYFGLFTERRFARIVQPAHCRVRKTVCRFCERYDFVA